MLKKTKNIPSSSTELGTKSTLLISLLLPFPQYLSVWLSLESFNSDPKKNIWMGCHFGRFFHQVAMGWAQILTFLPQHLALLAPNFLKIRYLLIAKAMVGSPKLRTQSVRVCVVTKRSCIGVTVKPKFSVNPTTQTVGRKGNYRRNSTKLQSSQSNRPFQSFCFSLISTLHCKYKEISIAANFFPVLSFVRLKQIKFLIIMK